MSLIFFCLSSYFVQAQSPDKLSFQAVIRDSIGGLVVNQSVGLRMSILRGSDSGSSVYTEIHSTTTNSSGLISIEIGGGTTSNDFSSIDWSDGPYYLKREVDPAGGTNYLISGITQLLSVPYAMYATMADSALNAPDTSSTNEIQNLSVSITGDTLYISTGNYVLVPGISYANNKVWNKTYGGSEREEVWNIQITDDGGYILAGHTLGSSDGDVPNGNRGDWDIWILKVNSDGVIEWNKTYGGSGRDEAWDLQKTNDGGYIVAGSTNSSNGDVPDGTNGDYDFWILKLSSDGTKQWDKTYGGSDYEGAYSIFPTSDGGYIINGETWSNTSGDVTDGTNGQGDVWILKINSDGTKQWDKTYGGSERDWGYFIQQTSDGGFVVSSRSKSSDGDITDMNRGDWDFWIIKLSGDGIKQWDKTYGGSEFEGVTLMQQTSDGGYIVIGSTYSSNGDGDVTDVNNGQGDAWILKLNSDGIKQWDKTYGGSGFEEINSIFQTSDGGYIIAGKTTSSSDGDVTDVNNGGYDAWILKLNSDGIKQWDKTYGGNNNDEATYALQTSDSGYIIAGYTYSSSDGDIVDENNGNSDFWILKLNRLGNYN
jgi:hypothetical protein